MHVVGLTFVGNCTFGVQAMRQLQAALHANLSDADKTPMIILIDRCLSRLTSWGNDSGASSRVLDHRLRRAARPQTTTLQLLKDLHEHIVSSAHSHARVHHLPTL